MQSADTGISHGQSAPTLDTVQSARAETNRGYRGRLRTGCLTCRARKVRCDEAKPICKNCHRLDRSCRYRSDGVPRATHLATRKSPALTLDSIANLVEASDPVSSSGVPSQDAADGDAHTIYQKPNSDSIFVPDSPVINLVSRLTKTLEDQHQQELYRLAPSDDMGDALFVNPSSSLISRDIQLTTTMDLLTARGGFSQPSFDFFLESVSCPGITPFDGINWQRMKFHVVKIAELSVPVKSAVVALSGLCKCQIYALTPAEPLSLYRSARSVIDKLINDTDNEFEHVIVASFLLCQFELIYSSADLISFLKDTSDSYLERLRAWAQYRSSHSELCIRLVTWLKILHWTTLRGGSMGLISERVYHSLPTYDGPIPHLSPPLEVDREISDHVYEALSAPIFHFYFRLQLLSGSIAKSTHYHRSRSTGADQDEVIKHIEDVKSQLRALWDKRCAIQRHNPEELRAHLAPQVATRIIALIGICNVAYLTEFVELDRVLGDPVSKWTDSRSALQGIRDIVDGDWEVHETTKGGEPALNPGYLRPLFLYAIECMDKEQVQWAVDRIAQIRNPIYRTAFHSAFAEALSNMQMRKERRVTSKYFCIWSFGVPPPFL